MTFLPEGMATRSGRLFSVAEIPDEMIDEMMNMVEDDDDDESVVGSDESENEFLDDGEADDVQSDTNAMINNAIRDMGLEETSAEFIDNLPIDMDETAPLASSSSYNILSKVSLLSPEEDTVEVEVETSPHPSTSTVPPPPIQPPQSRFKRTKRVRSPLPSFQTDGPSFTPGSGGFTGQSKYINSSLFFSLQKEWRIYKFVSFVISSYRNRKEKCAVHMAKATTAIARE